MQKPERCVEELCVLFGRKTIAYILGFSSILQVRSWITGSAVPNQYLAMLDAVQQVMGIFVEVEGASSASAWIVGNTIDLGGESPATYLRERGDAGIADVLYCARAYAADAKELP